MLGLVLVSLSLVSSIMGLRESAKYPYIYARVHARAYCIGYLSIGVRACVLQKEERRLDFTRPHTSSRVVRGGQCAIGRGEGKER